MSNLTSNGQVTGRDLRQGSVKTLHVVNDAITEPKLADDAVAIPSLQDISGFDGDFAADGSIPITTTESQILTTAVTVPQWANVALIFQEATIQLTITGGDQLFFFRIDWNDPGNPNGSGHAYEFRSPATTALFPNDVLYRSVSPGATVTSGLWLWANSGSNSTNQIAMRTGVVFGKRST